MIFVGDDWSENHHDIEIQGQDGKRVAAKRFPEGLDGVRCLHELIADQANDPGEVVIGIETDRGLWVAALVAAGYQVYAVNPKAVSRYRERHSTSGAKSDAGDAKVPATWRWLCRSVRTMSARTLASPASDFAPEVEWRSRYRLTALGFTA